MNSVSVFRDSRFSFSLIFLLCIFAVLFSLFKLSGIDTGQFFEKSRRFACGYDVDSRKIVDLDLLLANAEKVIDLVNSGGYNKIDGFLDFFYCVNAGIEVAVFQSSSNYDARLWYLAGVNDYFSEDYTSGIYRLNEYILRESDPDPEAYFFLGRAYDARNASTTSFRDIDRSKEMFEKYVSIMPGQKSGYLELTWLYSIEGEYEKLDAMLKMFNVATGLNIDKMLMWADLLNGRVDFEEVGGFEIVADITSDESLNLNDSLFFTKLSGYKSVCADQINRSTNSYELAQIGRSYFDQTDTYDLDCATAAYIKSLKIDPLVDPFAWHQLGRILFISGDFSRAIQILKVQEIVYGARYPQVYYVLGLTHAFRALYTDSTDDWLLGEKYFRRYLELVPVSPWAHTDLAWILFSQEKFSEMHEITANGLLTHPEHPWLLNMHGLALLNSDNPERALLYFEKAYNIAKKYTPEMWGKAYPGNDDALYEVGLEEFRNAIKENIDISSARLSTPSQQQ